MNFSSVDSGLAATSLKLQNADRMPNFNRQTIPQSEMLPVSFLKFVSVPHLNKDKEQWI